MLEHILYVALAIVSPTTSVVKATPHAVHKPSGTTYATFYNRKREGKIMANGRPYDRNEYSASFNGWKLGTLVKITNLKNHAAIHVRITDRKKSNWSIDLSEVAYNALGLRKEQGIGLVSVQRVREN
jgi:rare lipoprotein A